MFRNFITAIIFGLLFPIHSFAFTASLILEHDQPSAWNELLRQGLQKAASDFGIETKVVVAETGEKQTEVFRETAQNSDLVIVASDNLHEILRDNAANFRRVKFGSIDAGIRAANIMSVTFQDEQAAFLAGVTAAFLTKAAGMEGINPQKTIGWLAGMDTPAMRSLVNGFIEGAKIIDEDVRIAQAVVDSFANSELAAEKTRNILEQGADVVVLAAGAGNNLARQEVLQAGAWPIEVDKNTGSTKKAGVITKAADKAIYEIVASAVGNNFRAKEIIVYNLINNGINWEGIEQILKTKGVPNELSRRLKELRRELENGSIYLKSMRQRTLCDCLD